ncbi:SNF2 family N-terminal domain-containing protein [Rhexocercosporidium sp. MPI-PUGE-AT-0058]|nr:SNF2 family N-terminal domain-containing protein [Rhexocercosporidium sp. MPI-PUGE-AT-0058]
MAEYRWSHFIHLLILGWHWILFDDSWGGLNSGWTEYGLGDHNSWVDHLLRFEPVPNYSTQVHSSDSLASILSLEPLQSNRLSTEVLFQTPMAVATQENEPVGPGSHTSSAKDVIYGSVEIPSGVDGDEVLCFGMVLGILGECQFPSGACQQQDSFSHAVTLDTASKFSSSSDLNISGIISNQQDIELLQALIDETSLTLEVKCKTGHGNIDYPKARRYQPRLKPCSLSIIVYGPTFLCEDVGIFFQDYDIYLQDPQGCELDVRYCNPHRLSSIDMASWQMTSGLGLQGDPLQAFNLEDAPQQPDILAILDSQEDLLESSQPEAILTALERHQKQALTFMLHREEGWALNGLTPDIWEMRKFNQGYRFVNKISGAYQTEEPPQFFGGIIADPMGLGKTLSMIALIATDLKGYHNENFGPHSGIDENLSNNTTLVIVPPPVLDSWEEQLSQHVVKSRMTWGRHHGKSRLNRTSIDSYNLVLTTYHTVSAEWRNGKQAEMSILYSTKWKRVILDEAHVVRNSGSQMAKAICSLHACSRWAVTGTPIQNRLGDLVSLLKFLRAHPYDDAGRFEVDITQLWKTGGGEEVEEAVRRLQRLSRCLLLRRPKETINLPPRRDLKCVVEFNADERALYEGIKSQTIATFKEATPHDTNRSSATACINVIEQINSLRMICNMGLQYHSRYGKAAPEVDMNGRIKWAEAAQQAFDFQLEAGSIMCQFCLSSLNMAETLLGETDDQTQPQFSECLRFICSECTQRRRRASEPISCGHNPCHPTARVSMSRTEFEEASSPMLTMEDYQASLISLPSKVTSLMMQLQSQQADVKCLVFSSWRMTLNVVETGLKQANIPYLRFDGKVPQKDRQGIIERFRKDPSIKVMILTLSCGAVGLTLTEASYAYLMEPHWNPTIEEQALARIHRIGQKKEVTTVRFFVKDTFEERVMEIQKSKQDLANLLFSPREDSQGGDVKRLEV